MAYNQKKRKGNEKDERMEKVFKSPARSEHVVSDDWDDGCCCKSRRAKRVHDDNQP